MIGAAGSALRYLRVAKKQLKRLGGYWISFRERGSYALIGYPLRANWKRQQQKRKGKGPSALYVSLPRLPGKLLTHRYSVRVAVSYSWYSPLLEFLENSWNFEIFIQGPG